jgi:hypothetical protein
MRSLAISGGYEIFGFNAVWGCCRDILFLTASHTLAQTFDCDIQCPQGMAIDMLMRQIVMAAIISYVILKSIRLSAGKK